MEKISVVIAGIGGYGAAYLVELLHHKRAERFQIVGAVDPYADKSQYYAELQARNIPIYDRLEAFYAEHSAQLAILATPIYLHASQAIACMEHGSDVICEKPICATPDDAQRMLSARDSFGKKLAIGFQFCYSEAMLALKRDLLDGRYGKIVEMRALILFPRGIDYYHRSSGWAGKRFLAHGEPVYDCVASNATAHYLQNMLFLSGTQMDRSCAPASISAEVYRANPIDMYDTCAFRIRTQENVRILFLASHAVPFASETKPEFLIVTEKGTAVLADGIIRGHLDRQVIEYGQLCPDGMRALDFMTEGDSLPCPAEAALPHLHCVHAVAQSFRDIPVFAKPYLFYSEQDRQYTCSGLDEVLKNCRQNGLLPSETGIAWAIRPHSVCL